MQLILGNCLEKLKELKDNSVDSVVTDPPYGISFMGKKWDYDVPSVDIWKECLRVLKPGGYLLSFAGTRTQHRMAVNIEDAGFEIRDMIAWVYGSGFPKSLNIGKAVDKLQGNEREVVGKKRCGIADGPFGSCEEERKHIDETKGTSEWEGWGTALKPALEPITVARKPLGEKTVAENCLKWGVGGINIDGCRVGTTEQDKYDLEQRQISKGSGVETNINFTGRDLDLKHGVQELGRFPANLIHDGSDEVVGLFPQTKSGGGNKNSNDTRGSFLGTGFGGIGNKTDWKVDTGSAARFFKTCNYSLKHDTMSIWKTIFVDTAERLLRITQAIKEGIAPLNAEDLQEEQNDQLVKSAVSHADTIEILTALVLVRIKSLASSPEGLLAIQDFIGNCKECTQLLNLVLCVVKEGNTDITQITTNLWKSFGSVNPAITNSTQETEKLEPKRFAYIPKASKRERNKGLENMEKKAITNAKGNGLGRVCNICGANQLNPCNCKNNTWILPKKNQNNHPTVKPIALMEYLVKLVSREGQVVLDPFMGSGTTGMACKRLGREFIGIEIDEEYFKIAQARIDAWKADEQLKLVEH